MNKRLFALSTLVLTVLLAGCQSVATPAATDEPAPVAEATSPSVASQAPSQPDYCLECHADKDQLTALAKPEVEIESESKGVG
jgi:uncharacterized protein YceK